MLTVYKQISRCLWQFCIYTCTGWVELHITISDYIKISLWSFLSVLSWLAISKTICYLSKRIVLTVYSSDLFRIWRLSWFSLLLSSVGKNLFNICFDNVRHGVAFFSWNSLGSVKWSYIKRWWIDLCWSTVLFVGKYLRE